MNKVGSTTDINSEASYQSPSFMGQCSAITIDSRVHNEGRKKKLADPNKAGGGDNQGVYFYWVSWNYLPMQFVYDL